MIKSNQPEATHLGFVKTKCFTDFSNLDGFATGTAGAEGGLVELAVSDKLTLTSKSKTS